MQIVKNQENWIIKRLADELENIGDFPITYFMTYAMYEPRKEFTAALFTHYEEANHDRFAEAAEEVDIAIALSENTAKHVRRFREQCAVIHCGSDLKKKVTFGVVGRTYKSGRKGEKLIEEVASVYNFLALGEGWPCKTVNVSRETFYKQIDYLVVPSLNEGGPIPVLDAIAMGVPVISGDVGWSWDYPVIRFEKGSVESLKRVLHKLSYPRTWGDWKNDHQELFADFMKSNS